MKRADVKIYGPVSFTTLREPSRRPKQSRGPAGIVRGARQVWPMAFALVVRHQLLCSV